jgi:hypothetical protein
VTDSTDPTLAEVAEALCAPGYDARPRPDPDAAGNNTATGVAVHAVYVEGWRFPDGRWAFLERCAQSVKITDPDPDSWWLIVPKEASWGHRGHEIPSYASAADIAAWVAHRLPAPDSPDCELFRHPNDAKEYRYEPPPRWQQAWRERLFTETHPGLAEWSCIAERRPS